ncbi:MAG: anthranilate synthase component I family protein, partial [Gemmatimonadales bacterium]
MSGGFEAFLGRCRPGLMVPVTREVLLDGDTAVSAFHKLHRGPWGFLLESLEGGERWARYTFLSTEPEEVYRYTGRCCERWTPATGWSAVADDVAPLEHLGAFLSARPDAEVPALPPFTGGAVGFIGYDVVRTLEDLPGGPADDRGMPDAVMMIADTLLVLDNVYNRATVIANVRIPDQDSTDPAHLRILYDKAQSRIDTWLERLSAPGDLGPLALVPEPLLPPTRSPYIDDRFRGDVARIQAEIAAGETFQTVLSRRLELPAPDPFLSYRYLRALNPAPYLFYLHCDDVHLAGSSPEVLVRVEQGVVTVRPIAGTRPRGATPEEDRSLEESLLADPKERAEHLMLVDLGRNDVGRVAEYGSVRVTSFMEVER